MKNLLTLLRLRKTDGDVGIEIECEGENLREVNNKYWKAENDGSLRGVFPETRAEFILKAPIPVKEVKKALNNLKGELKEAKFKFSFRTSVHVHVNVQEFTIPELVGFIYAALLLEEPFMQYCGEARKNNRFCLRMQDAEGMWDTLKGFVRNDPDEPFLLNENSIRYANINLASLNKYGSLEFRGMRGNLDVDVLTNWAEALISLREFCRGKDIIDIHNTFTKLGPAKFMEGTLNRASKHFEYPSLDEDVRRSFSLAIDLPHMYKQATKERG